MKQNKLGCLILPFALSACGSIGDGNGPVSMELALDGETVNAEVFECLATTVAANIEFTNGSAADYARQATWRSSDESVLRVSNGDISAADGSVFSRGVLLPVSAGTVELSAEFLGFEDSITVDVRPSKIELEPAALELIQGRSVAMVATGILQGTKALQSLDMSLLGQWSVSAANGGDTVSDIDEATGVVTAKADVSGRDTVRYSVDFCQREVSLSVDVLDQDLTKIELVRASAPDTPITSLSLPPDASSALRVIGHFSGGATRDMTAGSSLLLDDSTVAFTGARGSGVVTSTAEAQGLSTQLTARFDPDVTVEGDEFLSSPVALQVLDVSLDPTSLVITPVDGLMLHGSRLQFALSGDFVGNDGPLSWDLTRDASWLSSDTSRVFASNTNGSRGRAIATTDESLVGDVTISALRLFGDGPDTAPSVTLTLGAENEGDTILQAQSLDIVASRSSITRGETLVLTAIAQVANDSLTGTQDISSKVIWSSSDESLLRISNASATRGRVVVLTDLADQQVTITARYKDRQQLNEVSAQLQLTINPSP